MPLPIIPPGLEAKADKILADVGVSLAAMQPDFLATRTRYWQGICTHPTLPKDGNKTAPDKSRKPHYQDEDWNAVSVTLPATMEIAVTVNTYQTPRDGWGYECVGSLEIAGQVWQRTINVGPETWREHKWQDVTPPT